jgi:hypothetical protein
MWGGNGGQSLWSVLVYDIWARYYGESGDPSFVRINTCQVELFVGYMGGYCGGKEGRGRGKKGVGGYNIRCYMILVIGYETIAYHRFLSYSSVWFIWREGWVDNWLFREYWYSTREQVPWYA